MIPVDDLRPGIFVTVLDSKLEFEEEEDAQIMGPFPGMSPGAIPTAAQVNNQMHKNIMASEGMPFLVVEACPPYIGVINCRDGEGRTLDLRLVELSRVSERYAALFVRPKNWAENGFSVSWDSGESRVEVGKKLLGGVLSLEEAEKAAKGLSDDEIKTALEGRGGDVASN